MSSYYKTSAGADIGLKEKKCQSQEQLILKIFNKWPDEKFTWRRIAKGFAHYNNKDIEGVSCKRALSNLSKKGLIIKLGKEDSKWCEKSGCNLHTWKLNK